MRDSVVFHLSKRAIRRAPVQRRWGYTLALCGLAVVLLLSACEVQAPAEVTPVFVEEYAALVSVTGKVAPAVWTTVGPQTSGMVVEVLVEEGAQVAADAVLARLDNTDALLAVQQAAAAVAAAEAQVAAAQAQVAAAEAQVARAKVGARPAEIAVAEAQVAAAQTVISQTLAQRTQLWSGASEADIAAAEAAVAAAQAEQLIARQRHDETLKCYDVPGSSEKACPLLGTTEEQARYALNAANEALAAAEARLQAAQSGPAAQRRITDANVAAATAQYEVAVAQLELLKAGALPEDVALAEAAVAQAKAALDAAQATLDAAQVTLEAAQVALARTEIIAPFAGTVTRVDVRRGEFVAPGQSLFTLGDLSTLRVETTDLDEIDVARITVGQAATLTFDALPDVALTGHIARIAPMAEAGTGGVHYTVILDPGALPPQIRWGMTVFIDIDVNP